MSDSETQPAPAEGIEFPELSDAPLSPPSDSIRVTDDGGVLKHVVAEGSGDKPPLHARCLVHYVGRCIPSGDVFMDTKQESQSGEPLAVVAGRDSATRETGLNLAVATMRPGERSWVYITDPKYGYGEKGSFSFPSVPPSCLLVYDVKLITWEPPDEARDRRSMLFEERLETAERRRLEGNALFAEGKYTEALGKYALAMSYCDEDFMLQLQGPHLDKAEAVTDPIFLNMSAAQLRLGDYAMAAHNATQILMRHPKNVKALFRRAKARAGLGRTEEAMEDLTVAAALEPDDKQIQKELRALKAVVKEEKAASAKLFKGSLGPPPKPRPEGSEGSMSAAAAAVDRPRAAAAAAAGSSSSSRRSEGWIQYLFALLAVLLGWLRGLLSWRRQRPAAQLRQS